MLDMYLGLPSLIWDRDTKRRSLYGDFGAFRPKPYGLEYRVLSNAWLAHTRTIGFVYRSARMAMARFAKKPEQLDLEALEYLRDAAGDVELKNFLRDEEIPYLL